MELGRVIKEVESNQEKGIGHPLGHSTTSQGGVALPPGETIIDSSRASHPLDPPSTLQSRLVSHSNSSIHNIKCQSSTFQSGLAFSTKISSSKSIISTSTVPGKDESKVKNSTVPNEAESETKLKDLNSTVPKEAESIN